MYSKEIVRKLALTTRSAEALDQSILCELFDVHSEALGAEVPVALLRPREEHERQAVFLHLDGGVGDRNTLVGRRQLIAALIETGVIPPSIHVSFSGGPSAFYTGAWESWVVDELPRWLSQQHRVATDAANVAITGISAGGFGALKIAFKRPERFAAVAAMEPTVLPSLHWPPSHTRASWWMLEDSARAVWGDPFPQRFLSEHPPNIVEANAARIRAANLDIYLEVGDEDLLSLQDGAEHLHRVLWRCDVPHEFHQVRWADHGGASIDDRLVETLSFLSASLRGGRRQSRNVALSDAEHRFVDYVLSGGPARGEPLPEGASQGTPETELAVMDKLWQPLRQVAEANDPDMQRHYGRIPEP